MKCIVIYFSQTGNTEKVARAIQAGIEQVGGHCDLSEIRQVDPLRLQDYDLIGIGSPVMGADPANVGDFVNRLRFVGGKHAFVFYTHGTSPGFFWPSIYPKLSAHGLVVIGQAHWYGDCHLLHMPQPYPTAGHPDEMDLEEAERFGREMAIRSAHIRAGETDLIPPAPPAIPPRPPRVDDGRSMLDLINAFGSMLQFDREKCLYPDCRLCMDNCPTYGNDLSVDPPILGEPCLGCEFCARLCPTGALDMSAWVQEMIEATKKHLPMMLPGLEKAEAEGLFRRLIPIEKIDVDNPGIRQYTKHPQWIIGKGPQKPPEAHKNDR